MLNYAEVLMSVFHHNLIVKKHSVVLGHRSATENKTCFISAKSVTWKQLDGNKMTWNIRWNDAERTCDTLNWGRQQNKDVSNPVMGLGEEKQYNWNKIRNKKITLIKWLLKEQLNPKDITVKQWDGMSQDLIYFYYYYCHVNNKYNCEN